MPDISTKNCSNPKCTQINPQSLINFNKRKKSKDGLSCWCKDCHKNYHFENKEKIRIQRTEYRIKNKEIIAIKDAIKYEKNKEKIAIQKAIYRKKKKKEIAIQKALHYQKNKEKQYREHRAYVEKHREKDREYKAAYKKKNQGKTNADTANRRAKKLSATPKWLTREQRKQIQECYNLAVKLTKETGILHHVDHIIPLRGKRVSGLHVPWNLQVIPAYGPDGNYIKGNKF